MSRKKYYEFTKANECVIDKDRAINNFIRYMLTRTQSMFSYTDLPESIPSFNLEYLLQTKGNVFVTEVEGKLYALSGSYCGEPNVYDEPTQYIVTNQALKLSKTFNIDSDGVLIKNDALEIGLLPILNRYGALITENTITIRTVDIMLRIVEMISASDDRTQASAEKFIRDIENGKISSIGESAFFEGVKLHSATSTQNYLQQFIELEQYLKASCFNEIGLNANYNMKRSALGANESALNDDFLLPLVDDMIKQRQQGINKINNKYGTSITIDYSSAWKVTHDENAKQVAISESIIDSVETGISDVSINQKNGIHDINKPVITISESGNKPEEQETEETASEPKEQETEETASEPEEIQDGDIDDERNKG